MAEWSVCPHCGNVDPDAHHASCKGKSHRPGLYKCNECREPVHRHGRHRVRALARSRSTSGCWRRISMAASKKGMSAHQLHRMLGVTYKTAWFMAHRIREAMKEDVKSSGPLGGEGKTVEADETYIGKRETPRTLAAAQWPSLHQEGQGGGAQKRTVVALVERGGKVRIVPCRARHQGQLCATSWSATPTASRRSTPTKAASTPTTGKEFAAHQHRQAFGWRIRPLRRRRRRPHQHD